MYDAAIIGTGPAGLAAALNFKLHNKEFIWFGADDYSGKVRKSEKIANYPGVPMTSGTDLNAAFKAQAEEMGITNDDRMVTQIMKSGDMFMLLADNDVIEAKTVLLCTGVANTKGYPGEDELLGHGVSYCATCDGFLYKGKDVAVFSNNERYQSDVKYLNEICANVYLYTTYKNDEAYPENVTLLEKPFREIKGKDGKVSKVLLTDGSEIDVDGFFILRDAISPGRLFPDVETEGAHFVVDRSMATNVKGVYAAGDCTGRPYQITKAVGEGNVASLAMIDYLAELDR